MHIPIPVRVIFIQRIQRTRVYVSFLWRFFIVLFLFGLTHLIVQPSQTFIIHCIAVVCPDFVHAEENYTNSGETWCAMTTHAYFWNELTGWSNRQFFCLCICAWCFEIIGLLSYEDFGTLSTSLSDKTWTWKILYIWQEILCQISLYIFTLNWIVIDCSTLVDAPCF